MHVFFSEPDGSTWIEEFPTTHCMAEIKTMVERISLEQWKMEYRSFTEPFAPVMQERRYRFKGMSYVEGKGVMFYDRIEEP